MPKAVEHFEYATHDLMLALDRLVGIGVGANRDGARNIVGRRELAFEQLCRVGFGKQFRFEIKPGRKSEIGVRRPRRSRSTATWLSVGVFRSTAAGRSRKFSRRAMDLGGAAITRAFGAAEDLTMR